MTGAKVIAAAKKITDYFNLLKKKNLHYISADLPQMILR
jgi:hypothetical protein